MGDMAAKSVDFRTVRRLGLALPGVEEGTAYGLPALKLHGQLLACLPANRSAEPGSLVVRLGISERDELVAADPRVYYLTDHYTPHPTVLVRLGRIHEDALRDLLLMSWRFVSSGPSRPRTRRR